MNAVQREEEKLHGEGFVKEVGFKPRVKKRELWMSFLIFFHIEQE